MTITASTSTRSTETTSNISTRIQTIDILRAVTMLLMIFVNDLWSLRDIPQWLGHTGANEDGMGFSDVIFPAFLIIVGMSIPFAVANRRKKGDSDLQITQHILVRALALLVMGLFLVNGEYLNAEATGMSRRVWNTTCCLSFILIWNSYPSTFRLKGAIRGAGLITLLVFAFLYRGGESGDLNRFSTYWWGILGLIGWAYLVSAMVFTFLGKKIAPIIAIWAVLTLLCSASHAGLITSAFINWLIDPFEAGAMPALTLTGVIVSMIYLRYKSAAAYRQMFAVLGLISIGLLALGFYLRNFFIISKILATPPWILICMSITIVVFIFIYWIADINGKASWFNFIRPAGTNTLLCYLLPHFAYALVGWLGIQYPEFMLIGFAGLIKSMLFALLIVFAAGWLGKVGVQLKL